jgi:hypothetical protein
MKINRILATAALSLALVTGGALAGAPASSAAQILVAQSATEKAAAVAPFTATPNAKGSLLIKADPSSRVVLKANGQKGKAVKTNKAGLVQVKSLTPGVKYTLTTKIAGATKRITAVPESQVLAASSLRVLTTEIPGQLQLTWQHTNTPAQGAVSYRVNAAPINSTTEVITGKTTSNEMVLTDLDLNARFEFSVMATNTISSATPTMALMTKSLNDLQGKPVVTTPVTPVVPVKPAVTPAVAPAPAPAPVAPSGPSTRTIYVCPDSFTEVGGLCEKTLPYTFTTQSYTYHPETRTENCSGPDCPGSVYMDMGYIESPTWGQVHCPNGGTVYGNTCMAWSTSSRQVTEQVKDAAPSGFTDTGTNWTKKDVLPAGYTDNGTNWVSTTAKVAREVPA